MTVRLNLVPRHTSATVPNMQNALQPVRQIATPQTLTQPQLAHVFPNA